MSKLLLYTKDNKLKKQQSTLLTSGAANVDEVEITFDGPWLNIADNCHYWLTYQNGENSEKTQILEVVNGVGRIVLPNLITSVSGIWELGIYATAKNETVIKTSTTIMVRILNGAPTDLSPAESSDIKIKEALIDWFKELCDINENMSVDEMMRTVYEMVIQATDTEFSWEEIANDMKSRIANYIDSNAEMIDVIPSNKPYTNNQITSTFDLSIGKLINDFDKMYKE